MSASHTLLLCGIPLLVLHIYQRWHLLSDSILGKFLDISPCSLIIHNGIYDLQCGDDCMTANTAHRAFILISIAHPLNDALSLD
jgi:hypothetical protein